MRVAAVSAICNVQTVQNGGATAPVNSLGYTYEKQVGCRSAIADKPRCSVCKLWQRHKCEKRASNIALFYGVKVSKC